MPRTSRTLNVHPIVLRRAEVLAITEVTPNMRRLTIGGAELAAGTMGEGLDRPPFVSDGFDDHVKLVVPPPDSHLPHIGTQAEQRFQWNPEVLQYTRDYTVRRWDRQANVFDIDVARHDRGLAADWAFRAQPGDPISFAGPKSCALTNTDVDWHLLLGDETALPAIGRWLEEAAEGTRAQVLIEVPTAADRQDIPTHARTDITWLVRDQVPAGHSSQLLEALRALELPEGRGYLWCAGEALTLPPIRRYLRHDLGLPKEDVEVVGYWRRPTVTTPQAPASQDPTTQAPAAQDSSTEVLVEMHEMTELLPPVITRVAATLGIGTHVAAGLTSTVALAAGTGVEKHRLEPLLQGMQALGLLTYTDGAWANTPLGAVLTEADQVEHLTLDNPVNRQALALIDLLDVLRTGVPSTRGTHQPGLSAAYADREADQLYYVLEPLGRMPEVASADRLTVAGRSADLVAAQIGAVAARPERTLQVITDPGAAGFGSHDCGILLSTLQGRTERESLRILREALAAGPRVIVVEQVADQAARDDHAAENALTTLAVTAEPALTSSQIERLLVTAGASAVEVRQLGWGFGSYGTVVLAHA